MTSRSLRALAPALVLAVSLACGGGDGPTPPSVRVPTSISLVGGDNQTGPIASDLPLPISVRVSDAQGPIPDVAVTFTVLDGAGSTVPPNRRTDAGGVASTTWRLGTQARAEHRVRATVAGLDQAITFTATGIAGPPALLAPISGVGQFGVVGTAIADPPAVLVGDAFGNPIAGIPVTFSVVAGNGTITGTLVVSNAEGRARVGSWVLGPAPGTNTLRATIDAGSIVEIVATGTAAVLEKVGGDGLSANAGTLLPTAPAVRALDAAQAPLAGVPVTFTIAEGGGAMTGAIALTDADGIARPTGWILGLTPGVNRAEASAPGVPVVSFTATGVAAVPAVAAFEPLGPLTAFRGNFLPVRPRIRVLDAQGNPVAGAPVVFDTPEGGQVYGATTTTGPTGHAEVIAWRLSATPGANTLRATVPNVAPVAIGATGDAPPPPGDYHIDIRYVGTEPSAAQRAAFDAAVDRWQRAILGNLPTEPGPIPAAGSLCNEVSEDVDDVVIFVRLEVIDGPGGVLGSAGPCWIRDDSDLTVVGGMRFDLADLATLEAQGQLQSVILHEMGHVLGIGTLWRIRGVLVGFQSPDPFFTGVAARAIFPTLFVAGASYPGTPVPVENTGGAGTRDGHWRESILRNELMTGFINAGVNPLSALSLGSLRDLGYLIDDAVSDPFELAPSLLGAPGGGAPLVALPPVSTEPIQRRPRRP